MNETCILVVDDDPKIRKLLRACLEDGGFAVVEADTADSALARLGTDNLKLVTLDVGLGADDGFDVARKIRQLSDVPIIMITGKDDVFDRVIGLEMGADDYITKPFHLREVLARVRSVLRRSATRGAGETAGPTRPNGAKPSNGTEPSAEYCFDGMKLIPDRVEFWDRSGNPLELTSGELKLLTVFLSRPKRVLSRDQLMDLTGGIEWSPLDRTVDNQVARLRKKIERDASHPKLIKTVRGIGYTLACDVT
jgi:DNA-binding response OmpR family regulator